MAKSEFYDRDFFENNQTTSSGSATAMIPAILELIQPRSVVDVGCGIGEFLRAFQEHNVNEILGIDGEYVDRSLLAIPQENFKAADLAKPFKLNRTFDLALCLEVAEHVASENALDFIESLTRLAPVILFSAAIPLQGGVHHVNEQWPKYWMQLFRARGFVPVDGLRKRIWCNHDIAIWYRQNALLFCTEYALACNSTLAEEARATNESMLSVVHPELYLLGYKTPRPPALS